MVTSFYGLYPFLLFTPSGISVKTVFHDMLLYHYE
jgi:hypothetical protein